MPLPYSTTMAHPCMYGARTIAISVPEAVYYIQYVHSTVTVHGTVCVHVERECLCPLRRDDVLLTGHRNEIHPSTPTRPTEQNRREKGGLMANREIEEEEEDAKGANSSHSEEEIASFTYISFCFGEL